MKTIVLTCMCVMGFNVLYSQHVPTLRPTNERLTKVKKPAIEPFEKGVENFKAKDYTKAKENFQTAISLDKSFAEAYINLSKVYQVEGDLELAKKTMSDAIHSAIPLSARSFEQLGKVDYQLKDYEGAVYNFRQAVSLDNKNDDYQYYSGISLIESRDAKEGEIFLKKAVEIDASTRNKVGLSKAQIAQDKFDNAIETLKSIPNYESSSEACVNLAIAYHGKDNHEETDKYLALAKSNGADDKSEFHNLSGLINSEKEKNDAAKASFDKAVQMEDDNPTYYNDRASHYIRVENYKDALTDLDKALKIRPEFGKAYYNRGIVKEMLRDEEGACLDWEYAFFLGYEKAEILLNNPICNE